MKNKENKQEQEKKVLKFKGEIKQIDVKDLIPYTFNNKIHNEKQVDLLANIIGKFGYIDEIVVDKNNILIAGHGRLESIKKMGYEAVEVKVIDIDSKNSSELRLLHNKIAEYGAESNLENIKIELDVLGYDDKIELLDISFKDLYPEFDAPSFDPSEYKEDGEKIETEFKLEVTLETDGDRMNLKESLESMGYLKIKIL